MLRVSVNTAPNLQWSVGRELRRRIKDAVDEESIEIPLLNQQVLMGPDGTKGGSPAIPVIGTPNDAGNERS